MKKCIIILSILATPDFIVEAYEKRGYFAIGGEWLIVSLVLLLVYGLIPTITTLGKGCFKNEFTKSKRL